MDNGCQPALGERRSGGIWAESESQVLQAARIGLDLLEGMALLSLNCCLHAALRTFHAETAKNMRHHTCPRS